MSDSNVMGNQGFDQDSKDESANEKPESGKPESGKSESGKSETLDAGSGEGSAPASRPRVQRQPKTDESSVHEEIFDNARKSAERSVASVKKAVSDAEPASILLSTTMIAVGSAAVGALIGWLYARR